MMKFYHYQSSNFLVSPTPPLLRDVNGKISHFCMQEMLPEIQKIDKLQIQTQENEYLVNNHQLHYSSEACAWSCTCSHFHQLE